MSDVLTGTIPREARIAHSVTDPLNICLQTYGHSQEYFSEGKIRLTLFLEWVRDIKQGYRVAGCDSCDHYRKFVLATYFPFIMMIYSTVSQPTGAEGKRTSIICYYCPVPHTTSQHSAC